MNLRLEAGGHEGRLRGLESGGRAGSPGVSEEIGVAIAQRGGEVVAMGACVARSWRRASAIASVSVASVAGG